MKKTVGKCLKDLLKCRVTFKFPEILRSLSRNLTYSTYFSKHPVEVSKFLNIGYIDLNLRSSNPSLKAFMHFISTLSNFVLFFNGFLAVDGNAFSSSPDADVSDSNPFSSTLSNAESSSHDMGNLGPSSSSNLLSSENSNSKSLISTHSSSNFIESSSASSYPSSNPGSSSIIPPSIEVDDLEIPIDPEATLNDCVIDANGNPLNIETGDCEQSCTDQKFLVFFVNGDNDASCCCGFS